MVSAEMAKFLRSLPTIPDNEVDPEWIVSCRGSTDPVDVERYERVKLWLLKKFSRLIVKMSSHYSHTEMDKDDLVAEGIRGLLEAIEKFDPAKGPRATSLDNFVSIKVKDAIYELVLRNSSQTGIPTYILKVISRINRIRSAFYKYNVPEWFVEYYINLDPNKPIETDEIINGEPQANKTAITNAVTFEKLTNRMSTEGSDIDTLKTHIYTAGQRHITIKKQKVSEELPPDVLKYRLMLERAKAYASREENIKVSEFYEVHTPYEELTAKESAYTEPDLHYYTFVCSHCDRFVDPEQKRSSVASPRRLFITGKCKPPELQSKCRGSKGDVTVCRLRTPKELLELLGFKCLT